MNTRGHDSRLALCRRLSEGSKHTGPSLEFEIEGMTCSSCSASVHKALQALPGVEAVDVNLATHTATIHFGLSACRGSMQQCLGQRTLA